MRIRITVMAVLAALCLAAPAKTAEPGDLALIPWPAQVKIEEGELLLPARISISIPDDPDYQAAARVFAEKLNTYFELEPQIVFTPQATVSLLPLDPTPDSPEAYVLKIADSIVIRAASGHGAHNAFMTLLQLLEGQKPDIRAPRAEIRDQPRFAWRGMMIDNSRFFMPPELIERQLDLLCEFKYNTFHWHLTDDHGWRIESLAFPLLQDDASDLGAQTVSKKIALDRNGWGSHGRGYYTRDEIRDIVAYAAARHIMVVPEIDVPGHCSALIHAYPALSCSGEQPSVKTYRGIYPAALCPAKEEVYDFLDALFSEIDELFPAPYVHVGGDEVRADDWLSYPPNQALMAERGLADKRNLQGYFMGRVNDLLTKRGKTMIAWDEMTGRLPDGAILQAWRDHGYARDAAREGHDIVVSLFTPSYLNYPAWLHRARAIYSFDPVPAGLDPALHHHFLGGQVDLWGPQVTLSNLDRKLYPRVIAHAEAVWSRTQDKNWPEFLRRLRPVQRRLERRGVKFNRTPND